MAYVPLCFYYCVNLHIFFFKDDLHHIIRIRKTFNSYDFFLRVLVFILIDYRFDFRPLNVGPFLNSCTGYTPILKGSYLHSTLASKIDFYRIRNGFCLSRLHILGSKKDLNGFRRCRRILHGKSASFHRFQQFRSGNRLIPPVNMCITSSPRPALEYLSFRRCRLIWNHIAIQRLGKRIISWQSKGITQGNLRPSIVPYKLIVDFLRCDPYKSLCIRIGPTGKFHRNLLPVIPFSVYINGCKLIG